METRAGPEIPLACRPVSRFDPTSEDLSPGRRLRVFAALLSHVPELPPLTAACGTRSAAADEEPTYGALLRLVEVDEGQAAAREILSQLPLRVGPSGPLIDQVPTGEPSSRDPELHLALQDLANEVNEDIREALDTLDDPQAYYAGVDDGIEPVPDQHVSLVIWALQRELNRELRSPGSYLSYRSVLPAAPLSELPWHVQRALVERRRLRFKQWGIGRTEWQRGEWSLWQVPSDADYVPRRARRLAAERACHEAA